MAVYYPHRVDVEQPDTLNGSRVGTQTSSQTNRTLPQHGYATDSGIQPSLTDPKHGDSDHQKEK